jgi:hypothetical protein
MGRKRGWLSFIELRNNQGFYEYAQMDSVGYMFLTGFPAQTVGDQINNESKKIEDIPKKLNYSKKQIGQKHQKYYKSLKSASLTTEPDFKFPPTGIIQINGLPQNEATNVGVFNILGEKVFEKTLTGESTTIDLTAQCKGSYFLKLNDNYNSTIKLIKK